MVHRPVDWLNLGDCRNDSSKSTTLLFILSRLCIFDGFLSSLKLQLPTFSMPVAAFRRTQQVKTNKQHQWTLNSEHVLFSKSILRIFFVVCGMRNKQRTSIICFQINCQQFIIFASFHLTDNFMSHRPSLPLDCFYRWCLCATFSSPLPSSRVCARDPDVK